MQTAGFVGYVDVAKEKRKEIFVRIAFFDSGIGGLTVLKEALSVMPNAEYIYYADTKNVPYGVKSKNDVRKFIIAAIDFLSEKDIQVLVVACNTATSVVINNLRNKFDFPILGMEPAIKPAIIKNSGKKILVSATSLTLKENKLETLITKLDTNQRIEKMEMDSLVTFAEKFDFNSTNVQLYLQAKLTHVKYEEFETIVLGCTHFLYYKRQIQEITGNKIEIIDGTKGTVNNLVNTIRTNQLKNNYKEKNIKFYSSGVEDNMNRVKKLLELINGKQESELLPCG